MPAQQMLPISQWNYYSLKNLLSVPLTIVGVSINRGPMQNLTLAAGETRFQDGFDPRFFALSNSPGNMYLLLSSIVLGTAAAIRSGCSMGPSPINPTNYRLTFPAASPLTPAEITAVLPAPGFGQTLFVSNAETPFYNSNDDCPVVAVDPAGTWVEVTRDLGSEASLGFASPPQDLRNGQIYACVGYTSSEDAQQNGTPPALAIQPARNPQIQENFSLPGSYQDNTFQIIGDMQSPRHSAVQMLLSDGSVSSSHGQEPPVAQSTIKDTAIFSPKTNRLAAGPQIKTPKYDSGFTPRTYPTPGAPGGLPYRGHVAAGFHSNDIPLAFSSITESLNESTMTWNSQARLFRSVPIAVPVGRVLTFAMLLPEDADAPGPLLNPAAAPAPGAPLSCPSVAPGPFPLPGQYTWATATTGPFPAEGFDFNLLLTRALFQAPIGTALVALDAPPYNTPAPSIFGGGAFCFDGAGGVRFSSNLIGQRVQLIVPIFNLAAPTADAPAPCKRARSLISGFLKLLDGRLMLLGGEGSEISPGFLLGTNVAVPEILDPALGTWVDAAPMPFPTWSEPPNAVAHPNGNVYVMSGAVTPSTSPAVFTTPATQIYNPPANAWALGAAHPLGGVARPCSPIVLDDGDILVAGGVTGTGPLNSGELANPASFRYRPSTDTYTRVGDMKLGIAAGWLQKLADGRILMLGGSQHGRVQSDRMLTSTMQIFDPKTNTWELLPDAPAAVPGHWYRQTTLNDGRSLLMGGIHNAMRNSLMGEPSRAVVLYDPPRR